MLITASKASEAAEVLGVTLDGLTPKVLKIAYRAKAKLCHPDHHGATELQTWARVSWSKEVLERWLSIQPSEALTLPPGDCRACEGTGRVQTKTAGFGKPLTMQCVLCEGTGEVKRDKPYQMENR